MTIGVDMLDFSRQAHIIMKQGIQYNKDIVNSLNLADSCLSTAKSILSSAVIDNIVDLNSVGEDKIDIIAFRSYLIKTFGMSNCYVFMDAFGTLKLDIPHALVLYNKLSSERSSLSQKALGVLNLIASIEMDKELRVINSTVIRGVITPKYMLSPSGFTWKRCPYILRKYMLNLTVPNGYTGYCFENENAVLKAYLMSQGKTLEQATDFLNKNKGGLFYSFLSLDDESKIASEILKGDFSDFDGLFGANLTKEIEEIRADGGLDETSNVYTLKVKPIMIYMMNLIIKGISAEIQGNSVLADDVIIYHLSPSRVGIAVKKGVNIEDIIPSFASELKGIKYLTPSGIAYGLFLD